MYKSTPADRFHATASQQAKKTKEKALADAKSRDTKVSQQAEHVLKAMELERASKAARLSEASARMRAKRIEAHAHKRPIENAKERVRYHERKLEQAAPE